MKETRKQSRTFWIAFAACLVVAAVLPLLLTSDFAVNVLVLSLIWSIMGIGWNFIGGYAGQISNGHALFYAIGAYAVAYCAQHFNMSPWLSVWIGIAISVALAFVLGKPLLRLNGAYFLIATMAVAECTRVILLNSPSLGGATGIMFLDKAHSEWYTLQFKNKDTFYYLLLGITTLLVLLSKYLDKSKFGYYLRAVKANETSAQSVGINTPKYKILAYMLSAAIVSLAGSLYAPYVTYVDPYTLLPLDKSTMICLVVVMGGIGKYFKEICLLQQPFVKDDKVSVEEHIAAVAKQVGASIKLVNYTRFEKGEGIEKRQDDLAEEVAKLIK